MTLKVREVDVEAEKSRLVSVLLRELEDWKDETRFDWLYLENPFGRARSWVLEDADGRIEGVSSAFPRDVVHRGRRVGVWVLGDFCVSRSQRTLGPALMLQRAVNEAVDRGDVEAWYDFPSRAMLAVHRRLGVKVSREMVRMVYPLKVDDFVHGRFGDGPLARGLTKVGNALLQGGAARSGGGGRVTVAGGDWSVGESIPSSTSLAAGVVLDRTPAYLSWRYRSAAVTVETLKASRSENDPGWLVSQEHQGEIAIVDWFGALDEELAGELVLAAIGRARSMGAKAVVASASSDHPRVATLERLGFHRRDASPFVVYGATEIASDRTPWFLWSGDRDS